MFCLRYLRWISGSVRPALPKIKRRPIMECMRQIDGSQLDGRLLQLLLAVLETGSVTAAAQRLGVTQSAVSHLLDKLRAITGDRLFVRQGRGIAPTAHALALQGRSEEHTSELQSPCNIVCRLLLE